MQALETIKGKWRNLPRWAKWLIIGGAVLAVVGGAALGMKVGTIYWQGDPRWGKRFLGNSSTTIGRAGCLLTTLVMASNTLLGDDLTPDAGNVLVTDAGGFSGANLILEKAAAAFGLRAPDKDRIRKGSVVQMRAKIDDALRRGGFAIVHVDKDDNDVTKTGDHFVLIHSKSANGVYAAADSAPGKDTMIDAATLTGTAMWDKTPKHYTIVGVAPVFKA